MSGERAEHTIKIRSENNKAGQGRRSVAEPGHQKISHGDVVKWENSDSRAVFFFPREELFGEHIYLVEKGESLSLTVSQTAKKKARYPYAVYTDDGGLAEGGSFPEMIVE